MKDISMQELKNTATQMRMKVIDMIYKAQSGHPGGSLSAADFVTACYFKYMNLDPKNPRWEDRDRMVLSKGHVCPIQYACLATVGFFPESVLDTLRNGDTSLAILDMSAACHTPDVIEMPYRPPLLDAGEAGEKAHTVRLGGPTCLAGDIIGDYSFDAPLAEGDKLIFGDMAIYTTCKNNTFNGMPLPPIWAMDENGTCRELVKFGYSDFKMRLGRAAD